MSNLLERVFPLPFSYIRRRPIFAMGVPMDVLDAAGQPLMEGLSISFAREASDLTQCPYRDHRFAHVKPMNLRAFKTYRNGRLAHEEVIIEACSALFSVEGGGKYLDWTTLWKLSSVIYTTPLLCGIESLLCGTNSKPIDLVDAGLFKIFRGFKSLIPQYALSNFSPREAITSDAVINLISAKQLLVGRREVCPAPLNSIRAFFDRLVEIWQYTATESRFIGKADAAISEPTRMRNVWFGATFDIWERTSLFFEAARCRTFTLNAPPISKHTFGRCFEAANLARTRSPGEDLRYFELDKALNWSSEEMGPIFSLHVEQIGLVRKLFEMIDMGVAFDSRDIVEGYDSIRRLTLSIANILNQSLSRFSADECRVLDSRDLEIYFGKPSFE